MKKSYINSFRNSLLLASCFVLSGSFAQITITAGSGYTDANVVYSNLASESYKATTNYGVYPRMSATAWTHSGYQITYRSLIQFDLSAISAGTIIQSAVLYLYSDPAYPSGGEAGNQSLTGSNDVYFQKITSPWNVNTVTWNTQPSTSTTNRVYLGPSGSATENITVDLTILVQNMINSPTTNYGIMMNLANEVYYRGRNYAGADHATASLRPKLVLTLADPIRQSMNLIFGQLDQGAINTGILTDFGLDLADETLYNGVIGPKNQLTINSWRALYASLLTSVINPSSTMIHLNVINQRLETNWASYDLNNPLVDLPALFIAYQSLRSDAVSQNLISISNNVLHDVPGRTQSPYTMGYVFGSAPNLGFDNDGNVNFVFRNSLFVNSSSKTLSSFQVDFGDGFGYQTMTSDVPRNVVYSVSGIKSINFKAQFSDGSIYYSYAAFTVGAIGSSSGNPQARYGNTGIQSFKFPRANDGNCPEAGFSSAYGATVTVAYGSIGSRQPFPNCTPQFIKPLIVVEGYDASKFPHLVAKNWSFYDFAQDQNNQGNNGNIYLPVGDIGNILADKLQASGYDLIFIDFDNGTGDIVQNALMVENVIQWVNFHKINDPGGTRQKNNVLGQSMGGLVARYAIADLEKKWIASPSTTPHHEVARLITQDSPHRGANVPLGFQAMVRDLGPTKLTKLGLGAYGVIGGVIGSFLEYRDVVPSLHQAERLLDEPATQQMLIVQDGRTNTFLEGTYRSMITFTPGYTPTFAMSALSNGSECGSPQTLAPSAEIFYAEANAYVNRLLFILAGTAITLTTSALAPGLGVFVSIPFLLVEPLTGKNWKMKFTTYAAPTSGSNQAYTGYIGFSKKILAVIPVTYTIFDKSRNSISASLPWDSAPGGYYPLQQLVGTVNGISQNHYPIYDVNLSVRIALGFTFVPTVSALDVVTTPITSAALFSPYTGGNNSTYASRFSNFMTQQQYGGTSPNNTAHLQFTSQNGQWLLNDLAGVTPNTFSCLYKCSGSSTTPLLAGPSSVCTGNSQYTLTNLPSGLSDISWIKSSNLIYISGQNTPVYNVSVGGTGYGYVGVQVSTASQNGASCGPSDIIQINTRVGGFSSSDYPVSGPSSLCINSTGYYNTVQLAGATAYTWFWPTNWTYNNGQNTRYLSVSTNSYSSSGAVGVRVANACDAGGSPAVVFTTVGSYCGFAISAYPNPANQILQVESAPILAQQDNESTDSRKTTAKIAPLDFSIKLFDSSSQLRQTGTSTDGKLSVDILNLPNGIYYLWIITKQETTSSQIIVRH